MTRLLSYIAICWLALQNLAIEVFRCILWPTRSRAPVQVVCIHRVGQIGDILCSIPAMLAIRDGFPKARLILLSSSGAKGSLGARELLTGSDWINRTIFYDAEEVASAGGRAKLRQVLLGEKIDLWFQLPQSLGTFWQQIRNGLFAKLSGAKRAVGFEVSTARLFSRSQALNRSFPSETQRLLDLVKAAGVEAAKVEFRLPISSDHRASVSALGVSAKEKQTQKPLGMNPGAKRSANRWPVERFAEIARRWADQGGSVVVFGGEHDRTFAEAILASAPGRAVSLCGRTTLLESAEALSRCCALVTNDTGTMHLAAAVGTPSVVANSARDYPDKWRPWGDHNTIIRKDAPCSPCFLDACPYDNLCVKKIEVDEVWSALRAISS